MKLKDKFLHIEINDGRLYVYADDSSHGKVFTLEDMNNECCIDDICEFTHKSLVVKKVNIKIPLKDFIEE